MRFFACILLLSIITGCYQPPQHEFQNVGDDVHIIARGYLYTLPADLKSSFFSGTFKVTDENITFRGDPYYDSDNTPVIIYIFSLIDSIDHIELLEEKKYGLPAFRYLNTKKGGKGTIIATDKAESIVTYIKYMYLDNNKEDKMYCPQCKKEYTGNRNICPDCLIPLVEELDSEKPPVK